MFILSIWQIWHRIVPCTPIPVIYPWALVLSQMLHILTFFCYISQINWFKLEIKFSDPICIPLAWKEFFLKKILFLSVAHIYDTINQQKHTKLSQLNFLPVSMYVYNVSWKNGNFMCTFGEVIKVLRFFHIVLIVYFRCIMISISPDHRPNKASDR